MRLPAQRQLGHATPAAAIGSPAGHGKSSFLSRRGAVRVVCQAAATAGGPEQLITEATGKLISKTEIPAFIQRDDLMAQVLLWAESDAGEAGHRNFGLPMRVEPFNVDGSLWGFKLYILKDGAVGTSLSIQYDLEVSRIASTSP